MSDCCNDTACQLAQQQSSTLKLVLAINIVMFVVEFGGGLAASSTSLLADSLDMLGDALVYGFSLYVVGRNDAWKSASAFLKGGIMVAFGVFVLVDAAWKYLHPHVPAYQLIGFVGGVALLANGCCLYLLTRHRDDDVNMRSVWLCSRNDIIANVSVLIAAASVLATGSQWPDLLVGAGIAILFLRSSLSVFVDAGRTLKSHNAQVL